MLEVELKVRAGHDRVRAALADRDADPVARVRQVDTYYDAPDRDFAETDEALRLRRETRRPIERDGGPGDEVEGGTGPTGETEDTTGPAGEADGTLEPTGDADGTTGLAGAADGASRSGGAVDAVDESATEPSRTVLTYKGPLVEAESKTRREAETAVEDADAAADILEALGYEIAASVEKRRDLFRVDSYLVSLDDVDGAGEFVEVERAIEDGADADVDAVREGAAAVLRSLGCDPATQIRTSYLEMVLDGEDGESV